MEVLYEWKQEYFPTTSATRQELNQALGKLAVEAIAQSSSRFRLTRRLVCEVLGEPGTPLFQLAIQLGWLNQVGVAAEDPDEPVYAFYHPTFQEYFAALAIDDWHCFLNHVPDNPNLGIYRVFEPQWKEMILLWLGREDVPKQEKEEFIKALVEFDDGCWYFYRLRAYLLAAAGIAEFKACSLRAEIVEQIVYWSFYIDELGVKREPWWKFFCPVEAAREVLKETERETAIALLVELLKSDEDIDTDSIEEKALILGQVDPNNETAISILVEAIQLAWLDESIIDKDSLKELADSFVKQFNPPHKLPSNYNYTLVFRGKEDLRCPMLLSTKTLLAKASWTQSPFIDPDILKQRANRLSQVDPDNEAAIVFLTDLIQTYEDGDVVLQAAESLAQFDPGNQTAISFLLRLIQTYEDEDTRLIATSSLSKIAPGKTAITILLQLIHGIQDKYFRSQELLIKRYKESSSIDISDICRLQELCIIAASNLGEIAPGNETAITYLRVCRSATRSKIQS